MGRVRLKGRGIEMPVSEVVVVNTCGICGKTFVPAPYHVYHEAKKTKRVCSYHCMLESERRYEENKKKTGAAAHKKRRKEE